MSELDKKITIYLGRKPNFSSEVILQDDGDGAYIKEWNVAEAQPTDEQLNALESQANTLEASNQVIANRKAEYPSIEQLVVALYDTEDKLAIENKRKAVKDKYPK
jgi:hypothetical protein